ncbi:hypothetical protein P5V15_011236 [Pogonomyrmex californicus]
MYITKRTTLIFATVYVTLIAQETVASAHSIPFNKKSIGICIIGNYSTRTPNAAAVRAVAYLIFQGVENGKIKSDYKLLGHRQTWPTMCPGDSLYTMIKSWPHWSDRE